MRGWIFILLIFLVCLIALVASERKSADAVSGSSNTVAKKASGKKHHGHGKKHHGKKHHGHHGKKHHAKVAKDKKQESKKAEKAAPAKAAEPPKATKKRAEPEEEEWEDEDWDDEDWEDDEGEEEEEEGEEEHEPGAATTPKKDEKKEPQPPKEPPKPEHVEPVEHIDAILVNDPQANHLHHSFSSPLQTDKAVPYWDDGANCQIHEQFVRLTEDRQSRTGFLWNNVVSTMTDWETTIEFSVTGRPLLGGDGFGFWYVEQPALVGPVFGSADYWNGLLIAFDTFNNDGQGRSPLISAILNDGTKKFDHSNDGESQALASCSANIRNRPNHVFARISYKDKTLKLEIALERDASNSPIYEKCFEVKDINLGIDKFFGLTAHTGDVADNHDIYSFQTKDLSPPKADLSAVRKAFADTQHKMHQQELVEHQQMDDADFKYQVMHLLNQIQSSTNVLEVTTIAIGDLLTAQKADEHSNQQQQQQPTPTPTPAPTESTPAHPAATTAHTDEISSQLHRVFEHTSTILSTVHSMSQVVDKKLPDSMRSSLATELNNALQVERRFMIESIHNPLKEEIHAVSRQMSDLATRLQYLQQQQNQPQQTSDSGVSWFALSMFAFVLVVANVLFCIFTRPSKERYPFKGV